MIEQFWSVVLKLFAALVIGPWSIVTGAFLLAMILPSGSNGGSSGDIVVTINKSGD